MLCPPQGHPFTDGFYYNLYNLRSLCLPTSDSPSGTVTDIPGECHVSAPVTKGPNWFPKPSMTWFYHKANDDKCVGGDNKNWRPEAFWGLEKGGVLTWLKYARLGSCDFTSFYDTPEAGRTDVLSRGTSSKLTGTVPIRSQHPPRLREGTRLESLGRETSVTINDSVMKAFLYNMVQWSCISCHHWYMVRVFAKA